MFFTMIEKRPHSDQRIINCLNANYGIAVAALTLLPLGADMHAAVYKAQADDQASYFVKLKQGRRQDISAAIIELLHEAGVQEIIPPVKTLHGQLVQTLADETLIVYPFVEGENGFNRQLADHQWIKLGKALRKVHSMDVPPSIQNQIRRESYSSKWREAVRSFYALLETEPVGDATTLKLSKFMRENLPAIRRLVNNAEELGHKLQGRSPKFVLCHSDMHGGNVLVDGNDMIYIVDWDDPIMAPRSVISCLLAEVSPTFGISPMRKNSSMKATERLKLIH